MVGKKLQTISIALLLATALVIGCSYMPVRVEVAKKYEPTWESLKEYPVPGWLRDGKFGIYTHWGPYSVHGQGPNGTWYSHIIYNYEESEQRKHHERTYGPLEEFGYKDFIPMFKAEKFDADEWAELFQKAGAKFAGPVAEHHDGFAMWDTEYSEWNAAKMGPKRDIVGELEKAIKKRDMKFVTAFHHAANWFFFPTWDERYDTGDPQYSGLYGPKHEENVMETQAQPNEEFLHEWYGKIIEVIDKYEPDFIWFDFFLGKMREDLRQKFLAYYYNHAERRGKEVVVTYKGHDLPPGVGLRDLEGLTYYEWITDTSVDDQGAWSYVPAAKFKSVNRLVDNLVDRVSKNGFLLLNVGPAPDGTIPEPAKKCLLGIGEWLEVNGEAIYGTRAWSTYGEGPTVLEESSDIGFNEADVVYQAEDIRFTVKENILYAICLGWPGDEVVIRMFGKEIEDEEEEEAEEEEMEDEEDEEEEEEDEGEWAPGREDVILYASEIESITMLGDGQELDWVMEDEGLVIETPDRRPCEHAYVFKIVRKTS